MITCRECGEMVEALEWAGHKASHSGSPQRSMFDEKKLQKASKAVKKFSTLMSKSVSVSIGIDKKHLFEIPPEK